MNDSAQQGVLATGDRSLLEHLNTMNAKQMFNALRGDRRGIALGDLPGVAISLLVVVVVFIVGYLILAGLGDSTTNASADRAVGNFTLTYDNIIAYAPIWGTVLGAVILLGIVIGALMMGRRGPGAGL